MVLLLYESELYTCFKEILEATDSRVFILNCLEFNCCCLKMDEILRLWLNFDKIKNIFGKVSSSEVICRGVNMGDGGGQSGKKAENNFDYRHRKKKGSVIKDFAHSIARIGVAQICESSGFQGFQQSALDTFSDVAVRYIEEIGKTSNLYANLACRSHCNMFDVIQGLEDLGSVQGFLGASDTHLRLSGSVTLREIIRYVGGAEEIPFAYSIPGFPLLKEQNQNPSFAKTGQSPPAEHIPPWLPAFPDPETYVNMHLEDKKATHTEGDEVDQVGKHREAGGVANFPQQMTSNASESALAVDPGDASNGKGSGECNPFLLPPLQFEEKEVSSVVLPAKLSDVQHLNDASEANHFSALETFAPIIEAVKIRPHGSEDGKKKFPLDQRPIVQFKFGGGKKSSYMVSSSKDESFEKIASWFGNDSGKDGKKSRAEQVMKKSIENLEELTHL